MSTPQPIANRTPVSGLSTARGPAAGARPSIYAIDFGTSNSLLAAASEDAVWPPVPLDPEAADPTVLRSILYFPSADRCFYGQEAIRQYVEHGLYGRFLRSIKKHLPSRSFNGTYIESRPMSVEDLVGAVLREMRVRANAHFGVEVTRVVLGRPARFTDDPLDDRFAEQRLERAAHKAGFDEVTFLPEPVAAAREFGEIVDTDRVVMVGDFGGGTSDFTVIRMGAHAFRSEDVLAIGGVAVAGDALDASIMRHKVAHHFGAGVTYQVPLGSNVLQMPKTIVEQLCSPAHLSVLRRQDVVSFLRNVRSWSVGPEDKNKLDQLRILVEDAMGFQLFEHIERAKRALSQSDEAEVIFEYPGIDVRERVTRDEFDRGSERAIDAILGALDETVRNAGLQYQDVDLVCSTGGTAKVPRIAQAIRDRFGSDRVRDFKSFHSVVEGLALHAQAIARGEVAQGVTVGGA
jgi:hypothetical chaperone protein